MPGIIRKIGVPLVAAALAVLTAAASATAATSSATAGPAAPAAYFLVTDITRAEFVIQLTDPEKIQHARDLISGVTYDRPHIIGRIMKRPVPYNPRWSYHYYPETIDFFDVSIEVCDATFPYVEDHLDEAGGAFLPGLVFCPWTSRLVQEVSPF
ncbi:calmodulin-binding protein [Nonomuraea sp. WAC 01424]|uniref:BP74-related protein n=1 Tax=Nonomuraea sp. WAC 01424 TaxID=2203200 RepID=UPI000F77E1BF|nr:calmodulin-binding protein [Nonomuraea sp. WAC 01424]RSM97128.1 calmodulin-binding protein [Nonomuraea sp. WAC 01424]